MNLEISSDSSAHFEPLQKPLTLALCLIVLLALGATSCSKQPGAQSETAAAAPTPPPAPAPPPPPKYPVSDLLQYAKPLCGTAADGDLYPGASAPFGMIQWSPDTGSGRDRKSV